MANPQQAVPETATYVAPTENIPEKVQIKQRVPRIALQMGVSEKLMLKIRDVQHLESQRQKKTVSLEETLEVLIELYLEKKDPVRRAKRQKIRGKVTAHSLESVERVIKNLRGNSSHDELNPEEMAKPKQSHGTQKGELSAVPRHRKSKRKPIPAPILHQVQLRDEGQYSYYDSKGRRCSAKRFLEVHHRKPVAQGGGNEVANLQLLCASHHKMQHLHTDFSVGM